MEGFGGFGIQACSLGLEVRSGEGGPKTFIAGSPVGLVTGQIVMGLARGFMVRLAARVFVVFFIVGLTESSMLGLTLG